MLPLNSSAEHLLDASSITLGGKAKLGTNAKKGQGMKFVGNLAKVKYSQSQNRLMGRDSEQELSGILAANQSASNEEFGVIFNSSPNIVHRNQVNKSVLQSQTLLIQAKKKIQD